MPTAVARGPPPAGRDRPPSPRYRRFLQPLGFHDERRAVLRVGDAPWGSITMWRRDGPFTGREIRLLAELSAPVGEALRNHARPGDAHPEPAGHDRAHQDQDSPTEKEA